MSTYKIEADGTEYTVHVRHDGSRIVVEHEGKEYSVQPVREATPARASRQSTAPPVAQHSAPPPPAMREGTASSDISAPMTGVIKEIHASVGASVTAGQKVITMEAMKMDIAVNASVDGTIGEITVEVGGAVQQGDLLIKIAD